MSYLFWLWLPIVGFAPAMILTMKAISLLYPFWIHTEVVRSLDPLEAVFNTPSHHRVHHGSNPQYNPVRIAFHEWFDMFRDVWRAGLVQQIPLPSSQTPSGVTTRPTPQSSAANMYSGMFSCEAITFSGGRNWAAATLARYSNLPDDFANSRLCSRGC